MTIQSLPESIELSGIDGTNPLGFLTALGTIVTLHDAGISQIKMGWKRTFSWMPYLIGLKHNDKMKLCTILASNLSGKRVTDEAEEKRKDAQREFDHAKKELKDKREEIKKRGLRGNDRERAIAEEVNPLERKFLETRQARLITLKDAVPHPELAIGERIDCTDEEIRQFESDFLSEASSTNRETLDMVASFGSDACIDKSGRISATPFCFITGSGHQFFLDTVRQLCMDCVTSERIQATLFEPWKYQDEKLSMRWDPLEDRRYALMDRNPTAANNRSRTVWMANLLSYRALSLFPSAPMGKHLITTGWNYWDSTFFWPMWEQPIDVDTIRSLLQLPELISPDIHRTILNARGIVVVYRSQRITVGKPPLHKINFSPSGSIL